MSGVLWDLRAKIYFSYLVHASFPLTVIQTVVGFIIQVVFLWFLGKFIVNNILCDQTDLRLIKHQTTESTGVLIVWL